MATTMRMESMKTLCGVPFKERTLTELDVSGKNLGTEGALVVAEYLDGNGALSSVNVLSNVIPVEQAQELVRIMRSKDTLTTLCGLTGVETELGFSSRGLGAGDAVLIANDISNMGALTQLDISDNKLAQGEPIKARWGKITGYEVETAGVLYNTSYHFSWAYLHY